MRWDDGTIVALDIYIDKNTMKRISLKNLRIPSNTRDSPSLSIEEDLDSTAGEYEQPPILDGEAGLESPCRRLTITSDDSDGPSTPRRKQRKGFFKTLKRKLTTNFKSKVKEASQIVDDDSSSETRFDDSRGARGGGRCPRPTPPRQYRDPYVQKTPDSQARNLQRNHTLRPLPTKEELSKSTESSTEDEKSPFFTDAEYGHASAPSVNPEPDRSSSNPATSATSSGSTATEPAVSLPSLPNLPPIPVPFNLFEAAPRIMDPSDKEPKNWSLTKELFKLSKYGWYWGPITRVEAEEKLANQQDGAFLVRDSSDERYLLSLSFRSYERTLHTRIEHCNGVFSFYAQPETEGYSSIVDLIEHSMTDSQTGVFCYSRARQPGSPSFPVRLTKPVSRFSQVRSLQYLCRFVIRQYTRFDHIQKLPLPPSIKGWLEENQY